MQTEIGQEELKSLFKAAIVEVFEERPDLIKEAVEEAFEDIALTRAIEEDRSSDSMSRNDVFALFEGSA